MRQSPFRFRLRKYPEKIDYYYRRCLACGWICEKPKQYRTEYWHHFGSFAHVEFANGIGRDTNYVGMRMRR